MESLYCSKYLIDWFATQVTLPKQARLAVSQMTQSQLTSCAWVEVGLEHTWRNIQARALLRGFSSSLTGEQGFPAFQSKNPRPHGESNREPSDWPMESQSFKPLLPHLSHSNPFELGHGFWLPYQFEEFCLFYSMKLNNVHVHQSLKHTITTQNKTCIINYLWMAKLIDYNSLFQEIPSVQLQ